jgi:GTP cyclohydrolase I
VRNVQNSKKIQDILFIYFIETQVCNYGFNSLTLGLILKKTNQKIMISNEDQEDQIGNDHIGNVSQNPIRSDAFVLSDQEKIDSIKKNVEQILETIGLDLTDDSIKGTPNRVAKMFVNEMFGGLHPTKKPKASTFENNYHYGEMLVEKNITVYSTCEHHLLPIIGRAHVAYISNGRVIGLSKMNRIVDYYAKRPQVQERLTMQIVQELQEALGTEDVACVIDAKHLCVNSRGIRDIESSTVTAEYGGQFKNEAKRKEFLTFLNLNTKF